MTRLPDWERRLAAYLQSVQAVPHVYGQSDCALLAAGAVLAMTGDDPAALFRGKYRSVAGSVRALREIGAGDLESTIDSMFGRKPPAFAQRGDLVWNGEAVGVCAGAFAWFVGTEGEGEGLIRVPRSEWTRAWRV